MFRTQLGILAIVAIVATRLVIGWHFYTEGRKKLDDDKWSAAGFLGQAKGPFADTFTSITPRKYAVLDSLLSDAGDEEDLDEQQADELAQWRAKMRKQYDLDASAFNIEPTVDAWWHHREMLGDHYGFQKPKLEEDLKKERAETRKVVIQLRDERRAVFKQLENYQELFAQEVSAGLGDVTAARDEVLESQKKDFQRLTAHYEELNEKFRNAEQLYKDQEQEILTVRNQHDRSIEIIEHWTEQLEGWIAANYEDLREYFEYRKRVQANSADATRQGVATLQGQASTIEADMKKKAAPLAAGLASIWEGFNTQLNQLAVSTQADRGKYEIERADGVPDRLRLINKYTPWFDVIVGVLLILGLFTRIAALSGAGFLAMIVVSQAPWMGDATSEVFAYAAEMLALLVLAAVGAGRYAGLDFFLRCLFYAVFPPKSAEMERYRTQRPVTAETVATPVATEERVEPITI